MKIVNAIRSAAAKARASVPWGAYIPNNKVLAGALAAGISLALTKFGVVDVPAAYVSVGAFAVVSYLLPESPVAAARVVAKAGKVTIKRATTLVGPVDVGIGTKPPPDFVINNCSFTPKYPPSVTDEHPTVPPQTA